jgi:hypothetical protein
VPASLAFVGGFVGLGCNRVALVDLPS